MASHNAQVDHEPTFEDIQIKTRLLNSNAISVPFMAVGGAHGHLGIVMIHMEYAVISARPWAEQHNPGHIYIIVHVTDPMDVEQLAHPSFENELQ
jgi:hypothetical protein